MNNKAKGSRCERKIKKLLETTGYFCVKAGGSLGIFDLLCFNKKEMKLIQSKSGKRAWCSPIEREQLELFNAPSFASKELWLWSDREKEPIIKTF
mgnify:CR=1 FL=1